MMSSILLYSIKSAIVLAMLYLPYMLMLRRESFFRFNRMMLLGILFLSLVLPLCNISGMSLDRQPVVQAAQLQILELGIPIHVLPEVQVVADGTVKYGATGFSVFLLVSLATGRERCPYLLSCRRCESLQLDAEHCYQSEGL